MTRCPSCPAREGVVCYRWVTGHARYCDWAAMGGAYAGFVRDHSTPDGKAPTPSPTLAADLTRRALILECDYLGPPSGCGCQSLRVCFAGKGRSPGGGPGPDVAPPDCLACVSSWSWP